MLTKATAQLWTIAQVQPPLPPLVHLSNSSCHNTIVVVHLGPSAIGPALCQHAGTSKKRVVSPLSLAADADDALTEVKSSDFVEKILHLMETFMVRGLSYWTLFPPHI